MDHAAIRSAVLTGIRPLARDTNLYSFQLDAPMDFQAGQFVNLAIPGAIPRGERSYSIWNPPIAGGASTLDFAIKLFPGGQASEHLRAAKPGGAFQLKGPYGQFLLRDDLPVAPTWFIATSTGLAPFYSMLGVAARDRDPRPFRVLFGCRDERDVFGLDALDALRGHLDLEVTVCLSQPLGPTAYRVGRVTAHLPSPDQAARYYLCGNGAMITEAKDLLRDAGIDRKRIHYEKYW